MPRGTSTRTASFGTSVEAATRAGDRARNQDQVVAVDGAAAVLDGATSWLAQDPDRDGGWYARHLGAALATSLPGTDPLPSILSAAIRAVVAHLPDPSDSSPYSTASIVRWGDRRVEVLVLGDSPVVVHHRRRGAVLVADTRLEATAPEQRERYRSHLRSGFGFDGGFADLIADVQREERHHRNRTGGFWVAGTEPDAATHAVVDAFDVDDVLGVDIMSDGVAAGSDYGLWAWDALPLRAAAEGPGRLVTAVHEAELTDPDGRRWPRTKRHDDKSMVTIR